MERVGLCQYCGTMVAWGVSACGACSERLLRFTAEQQAAPRSAFTTAFGAGAGCILGVLFALFAVAAGCAVLLR